MSDNKMLFSAHLTIELHWPEGIPDGTYDKVWDCLIDCGNNHSDMLVKDNYNLHVYFEELDHLVNAQVALEELQRLPL